MHMGEVSITKPVHWVKADRMQSDNGGLKNPLSILFMYALTFLNTLFLRGETRAMLEIGAMARSMSTTSSGLSGTQGPSRSCCCRL